MATPNPAPNPQRTAKGTGPRLLLVDANKLAVRRVTRAEGDIIGALTTLAPAQRSMLTSMVEVMNTKRRSRKPAQDVGHD